MSAPLAGRRVLVPRAAEQAERTARALEALGAVPIPLATIRVEPPDDPEPLRRAAREVGTYDVLALTSENAVSRFFDALAAEGGGPERLSSVTVAAVGSATARAVAGRGAAATIVAAEQRGEGLAAAILAHPAVAERLARGALRVLLPRARVAREVLPETLRAAGAVVDVVVAYETRPAGEEQRAFLRAELGARRVDAVLLTSGSTAESFADLAEGAALEGVVLASIGPVTTEAARRRGLAVALEAPEPSIDALLRALAEHLGPAPPGAQALPSR